MFKDKKILIILIIVLTIAVIQKLDLDLRFKNELNEVKGISQQKNIFKLIVFDVGQGDAIFIETKNKKQILIDGGPDKSILDKLDKQMGMNDNFIDIIILSHPHADHVSGLVEVLKRYEVGEIWLNGVVHSTSAYLEFLNLIKEKNIKLKNIFACGQNILTGCSDIIEIDEDTKFKILYPLENLYEQKIDNLNNSSIVIRIENRGNKFLLMGDAEVPVEEKILVNFEPSEIEADVIKVGHQGASDASSQNFLAVVRPKYAIISVGAGNQYGHPSLRIIRRIERLGAQIFRTDEVGDIEIISHDEIMINP